MRKVLIVFLVLMALFAVVDLAYFALNSEDYIFGTEIGGWKYLSRKNFIFTNVAVIGVALAALAINAALLKRSRRSD